MQKIDYWQCPCGKCMTFGKKTIKFLILFFFIYMIFLHVDIFYSYIFLSCNHQIWKPRVQLKNKYRLHIWKIFQSFSGIFCCHTRVMKTFSHCPSIERFCRLSFPGTFNNVYELLCKWMRHTHNAKKPTSSKEVSTISNF